MSVLGKRKREETKDTESESIDKEECNTSPPKKKLKLMQISNPKQENDMDFDQNMIDVVHSKHTSITVSSFKMKAVINNEFKTITDDFLNDKWSVIYFYPHDFEKASTDNLKYLNSKYCHFQSLNAQIIGISTESHYAHLAFVESDLGSDFKICIASDLSTNVTANFGVLCNGFAKNCAFIISPQKSIEYSTQFPSKINAEIMTEQLLETLKALTLLL